MRLARCGWVVAGVATVCAAAWPPLGVDAQRGGMFRGSADDPAISYSTAPVNNIVEQLNRQLQDGSAALTFEGRSGYLRSAIDALKLPVESQLLVFSQTSLQRRLVTPSNPRALFFNDRVVLAWLRDADLLEVAAHDDRQGVVFYTLEQTEVPRPDGGWTDLFDGRSLAGWKAAENPASFRVVEGAILAEGPRAHLFYTGPEDRATYENFEFTTDVKSQPGANSGIFFHTVWQESGWPSQGFEVQVNLGSAQHFAVT